MASRAADLGIGSPIFKMGGLSKHKAPPGKSRAAPCAQDHFIAVVLAPLMSTS